MNQSFNNFAKKEVLYCKLDEYRVILYRKAPILIHLAIDIPRSKTLPDLAQTSTLDLAEFSAAFHRTGIKVDPLLPSALYSK